MQSVSKLILVAAGALALSAGAASAEIVCNNDGDCWHVKDVHHFKPEFGLHIHPDNWKWAEGDAHKFRFREHEGQGYWRGGKWVTF